ncbi:hypothetical protein NITLEN_40057 [Nitrospira lenta]|uniref:Uncharacterized protein n=1 Tax=Nitrospira lenta TaxID=1436998 RepID=A0A330L9I5_9BACT|nr:hypothetical protein NITLEN_40057 [Nitrospira lenta]
MHPLHSSPATFVRATFQFYSRRLSTIPRHALPGTAAAGPPALRARDAARLVGEASLVRRIFFDEDERRLDQLRRLDGFTL